MSGLSGVLAAVLLLLFTAPAAFAFFAAYWAQQTQRNPWLWFFFGLLLMPLAGLVLLMLNKDRPPAPAGTDQGHLLSIRNDLP